MSDEMFSESNILGGKVEDAVFSRISTVKSDLPSQNQQTTDGEMKQGLQNEESFECELVFESVRQGATHDHNAFRKCSSSKFFSKYPLRAQAPSLSPDPDCPCQRVFLMSYGGGLVSGDVVRTRIAVGHHCCVLVTTQSFPKVYKRESPGEWCEQRFHMSVEPGGLLALLPDPVVCYRSAHLVQSQVVRLASRANLVLLDWYTAGRTARGEWWDFHRVRSTTTVLLPSGEALVRECLDMRGCDDACNLSASRTMGRFGVTGTCILLGPYVRQLAQTLLKILGTRDGIGGNPARDVLVTASPLPSVPSRANVDGCLIRFAATTTGLAYLELSCLLEPLFPVFGDNPFRGKF